MGNESLWMDEVEQVCDDYADGALEYAEAFARLTTLGLDADEADSHLDAAAGRMQ